MQRWKLRDVINFDVPCFGWQKRSPLPLAEREAEAYLTKKRARSAFSALLLRLPRA